MDHDYVRRLEESLVHLEARGVTFTEGLRAEDFEALEEALDIRFPPDLRWVLSLRVPVAHRFPEWRGPLEDLLEYVAWPVEGICFDIRHNAYWRADWGVRPEDEDTAVAVARRNVATVPRLAPIATHAYLPCEPLLARNPVFSVWQTDIIHRGADLADYLFLLRNEDPDIQDAYPVFGHEYRPIDFWTQMVEENQ